MSNKMLIKLDKLVVNENCEYNPQKPINFAMAMSWRHPNYETAALTADPIKVEKILTNKEHRFNGLSPLKKTLFKAFADGPSLLQIELVVAKDATIIDKIVEALLKTSIGVVAGGAGTLPWVGAALEVLLSNAEISKDKVLRLATGEFEINEGITGLHDIQLRTISEITIYSPNPDPSTFEPVIERVIDKGTKIGTLSLSFELPA